MKIRRISNLCLVLSLILLSSIPNIPVNAQDQQPPQRPIYAPQSSLAMPNQMQFAAALPQSNINGITLNWSTCGSCPQAPEVNISGNSIIMGIANRAENNYQNMSLHGVSALLPPAAKYTISFDFDLYTWDSYQPLSQNFKGYWDSYSVSVSDQPYWQMSHSDPINQKNFPGLGFYTGGSIWGQGILQRLSGSKTVVLTGNPSGPKYLNIYLDTASLPESDNAFPSWGVLSIKSIEIDSAQQTFASHAAEVAKTVVGAPYLWGGQGFDWVSKPKQFVDAQQIISGYNYLKYDPVTKTSTYPFDKGLDCAGLVLWSYNKDVSPTSRFGGPISVEGANSIYWNNSSDVKESDLQPGDLLFFGTSENMTHVAMYVGGNDANKNVVEAANPSVGVIYSSKDARKNAANFIGFRRITSSQLPFVVQIHSPATLVITDPDGYTITAETVFATDEEQLHEIPGVLYYLRDDQNGDMVYSPTLKVGTYIIQVIPKPDALPTDVFSLDVTGAGKYVELAQNVPIGEIPNHPFGIVYDGIDIVPTLPTLIYSTSPVLTVPNEQTAKYSNIFSLNVSAIDQDDLASNLTFSSTNLPNNLTLTNNGDGTATISGIVNVAPGTYTAEITVTDPGGLSDTKLVTIEVVYSVPTLPVLDNFNRANGPIGTNWLGNKTQFRVSNNQLLLNYYGTKTDIFWKTAFGADQEAYVTFSKISPTSKEQSLLLKAQSNRTWGNGVIEVQYSPKTRSVQVWTYEWPKGWVKYGSDIPVTFVNGDVFGARARADGMVEIYRNGDLLGTRDITAWSYYAKGGYIGLWILDAKTTILDDFGGGTVPAFP